MKSAQFSPDTRLICSGSDDKSVKLWDVTQKSLIHSYNDHEGSVNKVMFHPDGTCVASASADRTLKIWDIRSQRLLQHYDAHADPVNSLSFHPSGRYILSASRDSTLKIWDLRQGHVLYTLYGHEGSSTAVNFSPCGDYFTSAGADSIVMVWKSNLSEVDHELIEEFGGPLSQQNTNRDQPATTSGGIKSNRKTKIAGSSAPRYNNMPAAAPSKPMMTTTDSRGIMGQGIDGTKRTVSIPPEADANRFEGGMGSSEELAQTLEKVVSQLDLVCRSLHVLEQRISMNEESVSNVLDYFKEAREPTTNMEHIRAAAEAHRENQ